MGPSGGQNFKIQAYFFCNRNQKMAFSALSSLIFWAKSALWWTKFQNAGLFFCQLGQKNGIFSIIQSYFLGKKRPLVDKISKRRLIFFCNWDQKMAFSA